MNRDWFGDSFDIVKRFFVGALRSLGYVVYIDPMPTGDWAPSEAAFLEFLGAQHIRDAQVSGRSALFLDPDTGIGARPSKKHTTIANIVSYLDKHTLVFVFDQSFSRGAAALPQLREKLRRLREQGAHGFYYDSHARFLFASCSQRDLRALHETLLKMGLPENRIVVPDTGARRPTSR